MPRCTGPQRDFTEVPSSCINNTDYPWFPDDYELATPTVAGQPYAVELGVEGKGAPTVIIWGGNARTRIWW